MKKQIFKIVIIEDEVDLLNEIASILLFENYEAIKASDGVTGIQLTLENKPDMILCDIELNVMKDYFLYALGERIDNAFKFSKNGQQIILEVDKTSKNINIIISDKGKGFPPECVNKINAFVQFDHKKNDQQGIGLGVFIAQQIILLHCGEMVINSSLNTGSEIFIKLPV